MARIRSIKPDFWTDEKAVELSAFARLLFIGLWNFVDDDGRIAFSEKKHKMQILPSDPIDISELFGELRGKGLIQVYTVENAEYLQVVNFAKHQKIDKRTPSRLPPNPDGLPESPRIPPTEGKGMEEEKKEAESGDSHSGDFKKQIFDSGLKLIGGESKRSLVGKWIRDHGELGVIAAFIACQKNQPLEPIPYIEKTLRGSGKTTGAMKPKEVRAGAITL